MFLCVLCPDQFKVIGCGNGCAPIDRPGYGRLADSEQFRHRLVKALWPLYRYRFSCLRVATCLARNGFKWMCAPAPTGTAFLGSEWICSDFETDAPPDERAIEPARVAAQQLSHHPCDGGVAGSQQQVMVGHQSPCVTGGLGFTQDILQPPEKIAAVGILPIDLAAFDATANCMVQSTRGIDAGSARQP